MINKLTSRYQIQYNDTVIELEYDHTDDTFSFTDSGDDIMLEDFDTVSAAEDLLEALRLGVQLAAKLYGQPIEVDIEPVEPETQEPEVNMTPELERFLKERGLYEKAIKYTKAGGVPDHVCTNISQLFIWADTDEGNDFWREFNREFTEME